MAPAQLQQADVGALHRDAAVDVILTRLGAKRSAWNAADVRGEAEKLIASIGIVTDQSTRTELSEDLTLRAVTACQPLLDQHDAPEHVRILTSSRVLDIEAELNASLATRAEGRTVPARITGTGHLDEAQRRVVAALTGTADLLLIEGAAGTGKTTTLAAARAALATQHRRLVVVTPTLKAAESARAQVGSDAFSAAWLIHQYGHRWDDDGSWSHQWTPRQQVDPAAALTTGDVLLVDEAGMLDQDTARALLAVADQTSASIALLGDRHQLPAVGRGGLLDLAATWVRPDAHLELDAVHRFTDPAYADLTLLMRDGRRPAGVFDTLTARGQIVIHATRAGTHCRSGPDRRTRRRTRHRRHPRTGHHAERRDPQSAHARPAYLLRCDRSRRADRSRRPRSDPPQRRRPRRHEPCNLDYHRYRRRRFSHHRASRWTARTP